MIFYSSVAILVGILLFGLGVFYIIKKENALQAGKINKLKNAHLYTLIISIIMIAVGILLMISGIISFIIDFDLLFAIIFTVLIVIYLLVDYILQKKLSK